VETENWGSNKQLAQYPLTVEGKVSSHVEGCRTRGASNGKE